jgi:RHS repeat-associated protein
MAGILAPAARLARNACRGLFGHRTAIAVLTVLCLLISSGWRQNPAAQANSVPNQAPGATQTRSALASNPIVAQSGSGTLSGSAAATSGAVNLTTLGTDDWGHWGLTTASSFDHKAAVTPQIPTYTLTNGGTVGRAGLYTNNYVWTDGTPTASGSTPTGLYIGGAGHGFQLVLPADNTTTRTLRLYLGLNKAQAALTATLSDGSAAPFTDTVDNTTGVSYRTYTLTYQAAGPGQTLTVVWSLQTDHGSGSVQLHAAALSSVAVPTATWTATVTSTPTSTAASSATATSTNTASSTATATVTSMPSSTGTSTPTSTNTSTPTATPTNTVTSASTATATSTTTPSATATATAIPGSGALRGVSAATSGQVNLTTLGTADWAHWGLTTASSFDHKAGVSSQIPTYTLTNGGTVGHAGLYTNNYIWTDGTPTASATTPTGLYLGGASHGFQLVLPADNTNVRTLKLYLGLNKVQANLTATLSDGSAAPFTDTVDNATGVSYRTYTLTYQAAGPGQTLTVVWSLQIDHGSGSIQLHAAALSSALAPTATQTNTVSSTPTITTTPTITSTPTITLTPTNTSTPTRTATFTSTSTPTITNTPTPAGVLSGSGAALSGQVNLTTQGTADWAHWGLNAATSFTHKAGVTSQIPTFSLPNGGATARAQVYGSGYTWSDGTPTASATTIYGLDMVGQGHGFQLVLPADNTTTRTLKLYVAAYKARALLIATLSDGSAAPFLDYVDNLSGTTFRVYTLTYQGGNPGQTLTVLWLMLADHGSGNLQLHAAALSSAVAATPTITNTPTATSTPTSTATAVPGSGTLSGSSAASSGQVNLTTQGTADWAHWGLNTASSFNHKAGVTSQIANFSLPNGGAALRGQLYGPGYAWSDGTPTSNATTIYGVYLTGASHGFQIVVPADNMTTRTLKLYVAAYKAQAQLTATLGDGSAAPFTSIVDNLTGTTFRTYTLTYQAGNPGQSLTVLWTMLADHGSGNLQLHAAALSSVSLPTATSTNTPVPCAPKSLPSTIATNMELTTAACDTYISSGATVQSGATLTVDAGVIVRFSGTGSTLDVPGTLKVQGTAGQPVTFTSASAAPSPGDWTGLLIESDASATLNYATIADAGYGGNGAVQVNANGSASLYDVSVTASASNGISAAAGSILAITNSTLSQNGVYGLYALGSALYAQNDTFTNNGSVAIYLADPNAVSGISHDRYNGNAAFDGIFVAGGSVTTSATWATGGDRIELGGGIGVQTGVTLTIAAGTTILATYTGVYLDIAGTLKVQGTAGAPVLFGSASATPQPGDWQGLQVENGGSATLSYATIADAGFYCYYGCYGTDIAFNIPGSGTASLDHVTITASYGVGLFAGTGATITVTNSTFSHNGAAGISAPNAATLSVTGATFSANVGDGLYAGSGAVAIQNNTFSNNGSDGVELASPDGTAGMNANSYSGNLFNGIYLDGGTLTKSATWATGGDHVELGSQVTIPAGVTLTIAAGVTILGADRNSLLDIAGTLKVNGTAAAPVQFGSASASPQPGDWQGLQVENGGSATLSYATIADAGFYCYYGCYGTDIALNIPGSGTASLDHVTITASYGVGLSAGTGAILSLTSSTLSQNGSYGLYALGSALTVQNDRFINNGNVGIYLVDPNAVSGISHDTYTGNATFDGIFVAGGTLTKSATWVTGGDRVELGGQVTIPASVTLTIAAGITILATYNSVLVDIAGTLKVQGTAGAPVLFGSASATPQPGDWQGLQVENGGSATLSYATIADAGFYCYYSCYGTDIAFNIPGSGTASLDHVTIIASYGVGLFAGTGATITVTNSTFSHNGGAGISAPNAAALSVTGSTFSANIGDGLYAGSGAVAIQNNAFTNNGSYGVELVSPDGTAGMNANSYSGNGFNGIYLDGGTLTKSATWATGGDHVELGSQVIIPTSVTLTIAAGVTILGADRNSLLDIAGTLKVNGTAAAPVQFGSASATPQPGDWQGLQVENGGSATLAYATIADAGFYCYYGCYGTDIALNIPGSGTASLDHVTITASYGLGLFAGIGSVLSLTNSTLSQNGSYGLYALGSAITVQNDRFINNGNVAIYVADPNAVSGISHDTYSGNATFDGIFVAGGTLTKSATWATGGDRVELGSQVTIPAGVTLTIAAGVTILGANRGSLLDVAGTLKVNGTAGAPVLFGSASASPVPGDWQGLQVENGGSATLAYATIADAGFYCYYGCYGTDIALNIPGSGTASLDHVTIIASYGVGLFAGTDATITVTNSAFSNNANAAISIGGSSTVSVHNSTFIDNGFGISCSPCTPTIHAENNNWGALNGPAPYGDGEGITYHTTYDPITGLTTVIPDVSVVPWTGYDTWQKIINGPPSSGNGGQGGVGSGFGGGGGGAWDDGSANNNTVPAAEPVNTADGSYEYSHTDLSLGGRTPLSFTRGYNSGTAATSPGPLGYGWTFTYGTNLVSQNSATTILVTFGSGRADVFTQQPNGSYTAAPGQFDTLIVDGNGTYEVLDKSRNDYVFSAAGALQSIVDRNGNVTTLTYNGNQLQTVSTAGGRSLTFTYNGGGQIATVADNTGRTVSFGYSGAGDLTGVTDPRGNTTTYTYDTGHQLLTGVDRNGHSFVTNVYDSTTNGHVIQQTNALGGVTTFTYYQASGITVMTDPRGATTTYTYDTQLRISTVKDAAGTTTTYGYDAQGDRTSVTDGNGFTTHFTYVGAGNMESRTDPLGRVTSWTYDAGNQPLTMVDPQNRTTQYVYDLNENLRTITDPLNNVTTNSYDGQGDLATMADPRGNTTHYSYSPAGDRTMVTDPLGNTTTTAYDGAGRPTSVTDPLGHATHFTYDPNDDLLTVADALGNTTTTTYDPEGNRGIVTDPRGNTTSYNYDALNNLAQVIEPTGGTTLYTYDLDGNRTTVTDALNHTTNTSYDLLNRVTAVTNPLNQTVTTGYDAVGNVTSVVNGRGNTTSYTYDAANDLTQISYTGGATVSYDYTLDGQRNSMTDSTGTTSYTYDNDNHVTSITQPAGTVSYGYDQDGNRTSLTMPGGKTVIYGYDVANRLTSVTDWHGGVTSTTYDLAGRVSTMVYANRVQAGYSYDDANHMQFVGYTEGGVTLGAYNYTYDANGNRLTLVDVGHGTAATTTYGYDSINHLTSVQTPSSLTTYSFDLSGNRLSLGSPSGTTTYTYDTANEMLNAGSTTYSFDADGNRKTSITGGTTTSYTYDDANYLTGYTTGINGSTYTYNGDHVRVGLSVNGESTSELLDLASPLPTVLQSTTGSVTTTYLYGAGLLGQDSGSGLQFLLPDALGSIKLVIDMSGARVGSSSYDAYGAQTPIGTSSAFGFTSQQADGDTSLLFLRARMYDPVTGVFLQRDSYPADPSNPVTINRYSYAADNPVNLVDPNGLSAQECQPARPRRRRQVLGTSTAQGILKLPLSLDVSGEAPSASLTPDLSNPSQSYAPNPVPPNLEWLDASESIFENVVTIAQLFLGFPGEGLTTFINPCLTNYCPGANYGPSFQVQQE